MATVLLWAIVRQVFHEKGPRTYKAHLSLENVQEFREFIQAGAAKQLAESCESICIGQELPIRSAGIGHGAEFIQDKGPTVEPGTSVREQDRPTMDGPRRQCNNPGDRKNEWEKTDGHNQVEGAFPREGSRDRHLGRVHHVVHTAVTFRNSRRAETMHASEN